MKRQKVLSQAKVEKELVAAGWGLDTEGLVGSFSPPDCAECTIMLDNVYHKDGKTLACVSISTILPEEPDEGRLMFIVDCSHRYSISDWGLMSDDEGDTCLRFVFVCEVVSGAVSEMIEAHAMAPFVEFLQLYNALDKMPQQHASALFVLDEVVSRLH